MSLRKPYRSVNEQLRILRSRGMAVDAGAGHVLRREGYYPIVNGYKDLFLDRKACLTAGDDRYGTDARFDDLYALFLFDRELRELLFSSITCFASMFVRQVRQCFSVVWADGFPRCRHRFPVM
ncbi:Hypothetical protein BBMN68_338 [Bifidobacterium longum subsp. longum BBMN68]|nr:Hypothetical protein BBMN68_338 [Bifidobacterium longum subsp. longum BBMN68]